VLIVISFWLLALGVGGAYYGHSRWGLRGGIGTGIGIVLAILLTINLLGVFH
jgi:hypothetical protein